MKKSILLLLVLGGVLLLASCYQYVMIPVDTGISSEREDYTWDGISKDYSWYSADAPSYSLSTPEQFAALAQLVRGGNSMAGKTITLENDIDLAGYNWTTIGTGSRDAMQDEGDNSGSFQGIFDGQNHTISGLTISISGTSDDDPTGVGFFGTTNDATICNVIFEGANVTSGTNTVGVAVGYAQNTTITNVIVRNSRVQGHQGAGAIAGRLYITQEGDYSLSGCQSIGNEITSYTNNAGGLIAAINNMAGKLDITGNLVDMSSGGFVHAGYENVGGMLSNHTPKTGDLFEGNEVRYMDLTTQLVLDETTNNGRYLRGLLVGNANNFSFDTTAENIAKIGTETVSVYVTQSFNPIKGNNWVYGSEADSSEAVEDTYGEP